VLVLCTLFYNCVFLKLCLCLNASSLSVLGICLTYCFRVNVSAVLSFVGPAHKLFVPPPTCKHDMFEQINLMTMMMKYDKM